MQNTSRAHRDGFRIVLALFIALATWAMAAAMPQSAQAKEYEMSQVDMEAEVTAAGDLHVVENRQFNFDGSFTCVWWNLDNLPSGASVQVNGVSFRQGAANEVAAERAHDVDGVEFQTPWRSSGGPGGEAWSWDEGENTLYVFFEAYDESLIVQIDYTIEKAIAAYDDMGELYWKYAGGEWAVDSENVSLILTLPVPEGESVSPEENVYAWGHGTLDGSVHFTENGAIKYQVGRVSAGDYAEARVLFPAEWLTELDAAAPNRHSGEEVLESALDDEQKWADEANTQRLLARGYIIFWIVASLALLIWAFVMFFRYGKELRPQFTDKYWRDVPDKDLPPAVIGRLMKWNAEDSSQFTATLMGLSAKGVIRIDKGSYADNRRRTVDDYYLTLMPETFDLVKIDELERKAINLVFGDIAKGQNQLWLKSIELYGKDHPEAFAKKMESWQGKLTSEVNKAQLFNDKSDSLQGLMFILAGGYFALGLGIWYFTDNLIQFAAIVPTSIVLAVIAKFMSQRTRRGAELAAKSGALKQWLKDFTRLDERPPSDVKVWGQFMVYAFLFGIAEQVIKDMRMSVPEFRDMDDATFYSTMPYYSWYSSGSHNAIAASIFDATVSNTISSAVAAISESSGGGGGGGGFSGGGGGGFGGGGGGAR